MLLQEGILQMGTYINPGKAAYQMAVNSEIYIDKTEMIQYINSVVNTQQRFVSVSRPRRFGKTIAANMLCAYYDREADSHKLSESHTVAGTSGWDEYQGKFDVIYLVMTRFFKSRLTVSEALSNMQKLVIRDMKRTYPDIDLPDDNDLIQTIYDVYSTTGKQAVVIIDEWDAVFRERPNDKEGQEEYLDYLRDLLKDNSYIALAYMTGILPIKKYGQHSALNMFTEYSMMAPRQLAPYTGFTEEEVKALSLKYGMDFEAVSNWYDGYLVSDRIPPEKREEYREGKYEGHRFSIYSPLSVVESMTTGVIKDYWNKTETYEALAEYIRMDYDGLKEAVALLMDGGRLAIDTSTYQNDMTTLTGRDDVLSLLVHLGYLGFDDERSEVFIPNREILDEFKTSTKGKEWTGTFRSFEASRRLLEATWNGGEAKVAELIEDAHNQAGNKTYNDEAALSYGIQLAYYAAGKYYTTILELDTGKGYADVVYLPSPRYPEKPALLVELKYGHSADIAMDQIRRQKYLDRFEHYKGNTLVIGISYDRDLPADHPDFKHHSCKIEKW
jgi:hypothetical protein